MQDLRPDGSVAGARGELPEQVLVQVLRLATPALPPHPPERLRREASMGDAMSWLRRRLSCCPTSNATEDEESLAVRNEAEPRIRRNPTDMPPKAPPPLLLNPRGTLRGPLRAPAKAAAIPLFKAPPPGFPWNGRNREGALV